MSAQYVPVAETKRATKTVLGYLIENKHVFWNKLKPFLPYIAGAYFLGVVLLSAGIITLPEGVVGNPVGELVGGYFLFCFAITWCRVIILGPQRADTVNPFCLEKHETRFILFSVLLIFALLSANIPPEKLGISSIAVGMIIAVIVPCAVLWGVIRYSFYLTSTAVNAGLTLRESFKLSRGYVLRVFISVALSAMIVGAAAFAAAFVLAFAGAAIANLMPAQAAGFIQGLFMLPVPVFFGAAIAAVAATVLSNYYLLAVRG